MPGNNHRNPVFDLTNNFGSCGDDQFYIEFMIRFLNLKPADPSLLDFNQRIMWTPALHSATSVKTPRTERARGRAAIAITAGAFFVKTEPVHEADGGTETWFDSWLHCGMAAAEAPLRHRRHHPVTRK